MNAIAYVRISKTEVNSASLETQENAIRGWCERMGHTLVATYKDDGVSGGVAPAARPGASEAIRHARKRGVEMLVVSKLDRVSRDLADTLDLVDNVLGGKATLVSIAEQFDSTTPSGRMFLQMLSSFSEFERNRIKERTRDALATRRRAGRKTGGSLPFGYSVANGLLVPLESEQATLNRMFGMKADGKSLAKIADALNADGVTTRDGHTWSRCRVNQVINSERRRRADRKGE